MPGLGNLSVGAQGTAGVGDFLFVKSNGDLMTFMHEEVSRKDFLNGLPNRLKWDLMSMRISCLPDFMHGEVLIR